MPDLVLLILKYVFLAILWIFVARAVRAVLIELRPAKAASGPGPRSAPVPSQPPSRKTKKAPATDLVLLEPIVITKANLDKAERLGELK